ncbi:unnamed protein product [Boreogadus saida]
MLPTGFTRRRNTRKRFHRVSVPASTMEDTIRRQILTRLMSKFELGLEREPIDLDYFEFMCRQELYLCNALSRHVDVPTDIVQALENFFGHVRDHLERQNTGRVQPDTVPGEVGRPRAPLSLWHVDTNHKLIRYSIVLFGAVDGYSRKIMCLNAATNNLASTAFAAFKQATERHGIPSRVRADQGSENVEIARFMFTTRGTDRGSFMSGKSVHNQRIERLWRDVRTCVTSKYYNVLRCLEQDQLLDVSSTEDLFCVHLVFLPKLKMDLECFVEGWNNHPVRTENNRTPVQLWWLGLQVAGTTDIDQPENIEDIEEPDIDWDIAVDHNGEAEGGIVVPQIDCPVSEEQREGVLAFLDQSDPDMEARELYLLCREYLSLT